MFREDPTLSVVIPTYRREEVLIETIEYLLKLAGNTPGFLELLIMDQTEAHEAGTERKLSEWKDQGVIYWQRLPEPHITRSMNKALLEARSDIVLFVDDDIIPGPDMMKYHLKAHCEHPEAWAVVGQVLQPREEPEDIFYSPHGGNIKRYYDFPFRSIKGAYIENAMGGNLSIKRKEALRVGGFDENFIPPVASRFETEFAKRIVAKGGKIWFEPRASIRHLQVRNGGTRSLGSHLTSMSPRYGVGDVYFALRCGKGGERIWYITKKPFREVRTRFHLRHPWWIPLKFIGELLAIAQAFYFYFHKPRLIKKIGYLNKGKITLES